MLPQSQLDEPGTNNIHNLRKDKHNELSCWNNKMLLKFVTFSSVQQHVVSEMMLELRKRWQSCCLSQSVPAKRYDSYKNVILISITGFMQFILMVWNASAVLNGLHLHCQQAQEMCVCSDRTWSGVTQAWNSFFFLSDLRDSHGSHFQVKKVLLLYVKKTLIDKYWTFWVNYITNLCYWD